MSAASGVLVYGWAPSDVLSHMRVSGCTQVLDIDWLVTYMAQYGTVIQSAHCMNHSLGNVFDGVVLFTMQIAPYSVLPSFIDLKDTGSHLAECLFVNTDQHRHCFGCGHTAHVGRFCLSSLKMVGPNPLSGEP